MAYDHLDVRHAPVHQAGQHTTGTSEEWSSWATRSINAFAGAESAVRESIVSEALGTYASDLSGSLNSLANDVSALGTNTVAASNVVLHGDADANHTLTAHGHTIGTNHSHLSRAL